MRGVERLGLDLRNELDALVQEECLRYGGSGATFTVALGDSIQTWVHGRVGFDESDPLVEPATAFPIACIVKLFTATLALQVMAREGLSLDTPVGGLLPAFRDRRDITVRHLVAHTSGLDDAYIEEEDYERFAARAAGLRQNARPGEQFSYCHNGYALLGALTEHLLGVPWEDGLRDALLAPLDVADPFGSAPWPDSARYAWGKFGAPMIVRPRCYRPAGVPEVTFSTEAVAKLTRLYFKGSDALLPWAAKAEVFQPHALADEGHPFFDHVGLAWRLGRAGQASVRGVAFGSTTSVVLVSEAALSIAVSCNSAPQGRGPIFEKAINRVLLEVTGSEFGSVKPADPPASDDPPDSYCGKYVASFRARDNEFLVEHRPDGLYGVYLARSQISGRSFPAMDARLVAEPDGTFLLTGRPGIPIERLRFVKDERGQVSHFRTAESLYVREDPGLG